MCLVFRDSGKLHPADGNSTTTCSGAARQGCYARFTGGKHGLVSFLQRRQRPSRQNPMKITARRRHRRRVVIVISVMRTRSWREKMVFCAWNWQVLRKGARSFLIWLPFTAILRVWRIRGLSCLGWGWSYPKRRKGRMSLVIIFVVCCPNHASDYDDDNDDNNNL